MKNLTTKLVSEKELQRVKDMFKGRMAIFQESSDNVASWHGRHIILRGKAITPDEFIKNVLKVKPTDIRRVAKELFCAQNVHRMCKGCIG